jgi:hypothetical protein
MAGTIAINSYHSGVLISVVFWSYNSVPNGDLSQTTQKGRGAIQKIY